MVTHNSQYDDDDGDNVDDGMMMGILMLVVRVRMTITSCDDA